MPNGKVSFTSIWALKVWIQQQTFNYCCYYWRLWQIRIRVVWINLIQKFEEKTTGYIFIRINEEHKDSILSVSNQYDQSKTNWSWIPKVVLRFPAKRCCHTGGQLIGMETLPFLPRRYESVWNGWLRPIDFLGRKSRMGCLAFVRNTNDLRSCITRKTIFKPIPFRKETFSPKEQQRHVQTHVMAVWTYRIAVDKRSNYSLGRYPDAGKGDPNRGPDGTSWPIRLEKLEITVGQCL
jgi:hypothetical protein